MVKVVGGEKIKELSRISSFPEKSYSVFLKESPQ